MTDRDAGDDGCRTPEILADVTAAWEQLRASAARAVFLDRLAAIGPIIVLGGFPRRVALKQWDPHDRDVNLVVDTRHRDALDLACAPYAVRRNRFGGWKVRCDHVAFDIWAIRDTWAFRHQSSALPMTPESLPRTVFQSADAIAVDLARGRVHDAGFTRTFADRVLDIVSPLTLVPSLCAVRLVVTAREFGLQLSDAARMFLGVQVAERGLTWPRALATQFGHYGRTRISEPQWAAVLTANGIA